MQRPRIAPTWLVAFFVSGALTGSALAAPDLTLGQAVRATLQHNPQLAGYTFKQQALAGERETAGLKPALRASADWENLAGTGDVPGSQASELTLSLASTLELDNQQAARLNLVTARQKRLDAEQRRASLDVAAAVTHQFIRVRVAQARLALVQQAQSGLRGALSSPGRQVQAGARPETEQLRAQAAVLRGQLAVQQAEQHLAVERLRLSAFWGDATPDFGEALADLYRVPAMPPAAQLLAALDANPELAELTAQVELKGAQVRQARAEAGLTLDWQAGIRRLPETGDAAWVLGVSMPLGSAHRGRGAIATASAEQQLAEQDRGLARNQLQADISALALAHEQARQELRVLQQEVLPLLERVATATRQGFELGRHSYFDLQSSLAQVLETQSAQIDAAARAQATRIDLERLLGSSLTQSNQENTP